jgi:MFS family permease
LGYYTFGAIYGGLWAFITITTATAISPFIAGYIFDVTGNYDMAFILSILITIIALVLISLLGAPKPLKLDLSPESKIR